MPQDLGKDFINFLIMKTFKTSKLLSFIALYLTTFISIMLGTMSLICGVVTLLCNFSTYSIPDILGEISIGAILVYLPIKFVNLLIPVECYLEDEKRKYKI